MPDTTTPTQDESPQLKRMREEFAAQAKAKMAALNAPERERFSQEMADATEALQMRGHGAEAVKAAVLFSRRSSKPLLETASILGEALSGNAQAYSTLQQTYGVTSSDLLAFGATPDGRKVDLSSADTKVRASRALLRFAASTGPEATPEDRYAVLEAKFESLAARVAKLEGDAA